MPPEVADPQQFTWTASRGVSVVDWDPREDAEEWAAELPLNEQFRRWGAVRAARRRVDPKCDRKCLEREAQWLEREARQSEEVLAQMERGEFDSPLFMGDADIALMRHGAAKHRRWARELRLSLVRASVKPRRTRRLGRSQPTLRRHRGRVNDAHGVGRQARLALPAETLTNPRRR
jgi:hypothetical protein